MALVRITAPAIRTPITPTSTAPKMIFLNILVFSFRVFCLLVLYIETFVVGSHTSADPATGRSNPGLLSGKREGTNEPTALAVTLVTQFQWMAK